jgi:hypothetical protein
VYDSTLSNPGRSRCFNRRPSDGLLEGRIGIGNLGDAAQRVARVRGRVRGPALIDPLDQARPWRRIDS